MAYPLLGPRLTRFIVTSPLPSLVPIEAFGGLANWQGKAEGVIRGLREMATKRGLAGAKKRALSKVCGYLEANVSRMRYDEYLQAGYPIASGVVEGACRHLVKDRMERAGMHWTIAGAQAMLDVRSIHVSGLWEEYQEYRIAREIKTLYLHRNLVEENFAMAA